jgi:SAM-dependent methyltransferase
MMTMDVYPEILERVKHGEKFLDLGCCFGQELRKLVADGAPSANTYGLDLWDGFFDAGYKLFRDKDRLQTTFIQADILHETLPLAELVEQISIIYVGDLFHLFNLEEQEKIAARIIQLLAPKPDALILGRQSGSEYPGESTRAGNKSGRRSFRHSPESWKALWDRVGQNDGSKWAIEADLRVLEFPTSLSEPELSTSRSLRYTIRRL